MPAPTHVFAIGVPSAAGLLALSAAALGQPCSIGFQPGEPGESGIFDNFSAYVGPMTEFRSDLIITGAFSGAGPLSTRVVASFNPTTRQWRSLGGGANLGFTNGYGAALATFPLSGRQQLVVGGSFASMINPGDASVSDTTSLAAWDGTQWSSLGTGWLPATGRSVWTLLDWQPAGGQRRLVVGGGFPGIGSATAAGIAVYDGTTWSNIGGPADTGIAGTFSPTVFTAAVYGGNLYIGGRFASVNGVASNLVARWNVTTNTWQRPGVIGAGGVTADVSSMCVFNNGNGERLYVGGFDIRIVGQPTTVASFDGAVWRAVGQNLGGRGTALAVFNDGSGPKLYLGMTADANQQYLYRLENNLWVPVGGGVSTAITGNFPSVFGLYASGQSLYVGGNFQLAGGQPAYGIARYGPCPTVRCSIADITGIGGPPAVSDGLLTGDDFNAFIAAFATSDPLADITGIGGPPATPDGLITGDDFNAFIAAFASGCP